MKSLNFFLVIIQVLISFETSETFAADYQKNMQPAFKRNLHNLTTNKEFAPLLAVAPSLEKVTLSIITRYGKVIASEVGLPTQSSPYYQFSSTVLFSVRDGDSFNVFNSKLYENEKNESILAYAVISGSDVKNIKTIDLYAPGSKAGSFQHVSHQDCVMQSTAPCTIDLSGLGNGITLELLPGKYKVMATYQDKSKRYLYCLVRARVTEKG